MLACEQPSCAAISSSVNPSAVYNAMASRKGLYNLLSKYITST